MVGWHHRLDEYEFEQALGVGDRQGSLACYIVHGLQESDMTEWLNWTKWSGGFPYFLQLESEFCNKEFIVWATVSSQSCFCWLSRASPSSAAKNHTDFSIDYLVRSVCKVISHVVGRGCLLWPVYSFGKMLLALVLLHTVFQGQIYMFYFPK